MGRKPRASANMLKAKRARPAKKKPVRRNKNHISLRGVAVFVLVILIGGVGCRVLIQVRQPVEKRPE